MMRATRQFTTVTTLLLVFGMVGCATTSDKSSHGSASLLDRMPWSKKDKESEPYPNPVKMASTWTPDTLVQGGRTPTRGFGGRVFFYDEKSRPVPVEGTLIVHGFDDTAENPKDRVKRFEFTPEQFTRHFSQTDLGASYSVWIPWDAVGGSQRRVSLVASFKTAEGNTVQGVPANLVLPGHAPKDADGMSISNLSPQYQRYKMATSSATPNPSGLTTTTIHRRRFSSNVDGFPKESAPALVIPGGDPSGAMVAKGGGTPSLDVRMTKREPASAVRPVSAELPIRRR